MIGSPGYGTIKTGAAALMIYVRQSLAFLHGYNQNHKIFVSASSGQDLIPGTFSYID